MQTINEIEHYLNVINGKQLPATQGKQLTSINPANGKVWATIPCSTEEDIDLAIKHAKQAVPAWSQLSAMERAKYLREIALQVEKYGEELAMLETKDNGWVYRETLHGLIPSLVSIWLDAAGAASHVNKGETVQLDEETIGYTLREPLGIVVGILPWNAPLFTFTIKAAYALAAGNAVIIKPSEHASVSSLKYTELLNQILPPGILNVISGDGSTGSYLVGHRDVDRVTLTGSGQTARAITKKLAQSPKPVTFELGGKSPNIVFADADVKKAAEGVTLNGIFTGNAGQICVGGSRILVQKDILPDFLPLMKKSIEESIHFGDPMNLATSMGPIANNVQYKKVCDFIELGKQEGGEVIFGGNYGGESFFDDQADLQKGYWVEPTLLLVKDSSLRICQEEVFGPVAVVLPFDNEEDALRFANDTSFGLGAGIWTNNLGRAHRMMKKIDSGNVWVNTYRRVGPELPFGGFKESGFGKDSLLENTREKACVIHIG
ncbi:aldehyde dehydrogenase family protein [Cytobacillus sp. FSL W7-1323]|uniref:aldehyde dehydrogenase family protein n=1 Tax=Cytobacillus sp. FSL W7-1323 TaxID=2921700 RepID=UPI003157F3A5